MIEGPIGAAAFNNEFGRPNLAGYFRTFEQEVAGEVRGYHKPIMIAGGVGNIAARDAQDRIQGRRAAHPARRPRHADRPRRRRGIVDDHRRQHRRPRLRLGAARQPGDPAPRAGSHRPLLADQGRQPDPLDARRRRRRPLERPAGTGARRRLRRAWFELRRVQSEEPGMSPREIWCNEAQERYVLAIAPERLDEFREICERERCPFAVLGEATADGQLVVSDSHFGNDAVDMDMQVLLGKPPKMTRDVARRARHLPPFDVGDIDLKDAAFRVLRMPAVASKSFLITIGDRTVGGMTARDQMVGPWQVPVADCAVTTLSYQGTLGEAFAMGEKTPLALIDAPASGRMAVGEAVTNIAAAQIGDIDRIKLSANWMAAAGHPGEDAALFDTVKAVGLEFCPRSVSAFRSARIPCR
jgi:phosphoribosylformylglycinamidine synthase